MSEHTAEKNLRIAELETALARVHEVERSWQHTPGHYCCEKCALIRALAPTPAAEEGS